MRLWDVGMGVKGQDYSFPFYLESKVKLGGFHSDLVLLGEEPL